MASEFPPAAVCTKCGKFSFNIAVANTRCGERLLVKGRPRRCEGVYGSAIGKEDWDKCPVCNGVGHDASGRCSGCQATGWVYVRDHLRR